MLGFYFSPASFSTDQYDAVIKRLEEAGQGAPAGRVCHVAFSSEDGLHVFDVWESQETFEEFGKTLIPIMAALGADPGTPHVSQVHNFIPG